MGDIITRFKLENSQYESKLRDSVKMMSEFSRQASLAGNEFGKFTQKNVEAAKGLGGIATSATNAKDKVRELVGAYNTLAKEYNSLSKIQQQSDFGKAMAGSLQQLQTRISDAKKELYGLGEAVKKVKSDSGSMNQLFSGVASKFGISPAMFTGVGAAIAGIGAAAKLAGDNIRTAFNFEKSMSGLSALTGKTGKELEQLKEYAIELGSTTTLTASQVADAFRLIGSQQPQLLASGEALKEVTKYAIQLSEAAGIDLQTASQTLSTSINQMGGDSDNAARYVNVLAAAAQKGAGDIAWLGEAITKSATAAKAVGTDYEELVANLEQLAKGGFDASTAGTALRSIIMNLEKQANNEFKPSIVGLTQAFENLGKANLDIVGYQQLTGKMFASQAKVLAEAAGEARNMTDAITGTNIAEEQAQTNTNNLSGSLKGLASAWEGLNLHINSSNGLLKSFVDFLKDSVKLADAAFTNSGALNRFSGQLQDGGAMMFGQNISGTKQNVTRVKWSIDKEAAFNEISQMYKDAINAGISYIRDHTQKGTQSRTEAQERLSAIQKEYASFTSQADKIMNPVKYEMIEKANQKQKQQESIVKNLQEEAEEAIQKVDDLNKKLEELRKLRDEAADSGDIKLRDQYNAQIKDLQAQLKSHRGTVSTPRTTTTKTKTETQELEASIAKLTDEYQKLATEAKTAGDAQKAGLSERMTAIRGEIKTLQERNAELKKFADEAKGIEFKEGSLPDLNKQMKEFRDAQSQSASTQEWVQWQAEIDAATRKIALLKGELPKGEQATFTLRVNDEQLKQLRQSGLFSDKSIRVNVEQGKVDLPSIPTDDETIKVNVEQGKVDLPSIPDDNIYILTVAADTTQAMQQVEAMTQDIEHEVPVITPKIQLPTSLETLVQKIQLEVDMESVKVDTQTLETILKDSIKNNINVDSLLDSVSLEIQASIDVPDKTWEGIIEKYNELRKEIGKDPIQINLETGTLNNKKDGRDTTGLSKSVSEIGKISSGVGSIASGIQQLGIELPEGFKEVMSVVQGMTSILQGISTILLVIQALNQVQATSSIVPFFATGGIAHAANGFVPGNNHTDDIPVMVSSGELILNRAQQGNIASQLEGASQQQRGSSTPYVSGEQIYLGLTNYLRRSGRGELLTARG